MTFISLGISSPLKHRLHSCDKSCCFLAQSKASFDRKDMRNGGGTAQAINQMARCEDQSPAVNSL